MRRYAAALALLAGCAATPEPPPDAVAVDRGELRALVLTMLAEHRARVMAEKALADLRERSGCI